MSLKPDDLAQIILDSIDDDEPPTALYTLSIHEARMLANAVLNVVQAATRVGRVSDEAEIAASEAYAQGVGERPFSQRMRAAIIAALPHLIADDLRDTPAGRELMAEGWESALTQLEMMKIICDWQGNSCAVENLRAAHERIMENAPYRKDDA